MNFLFIIDYFIPSKGGVERLFEDIISNASQKGHKIKILTCRFDKSLPKYEKKNNIEIFRIGKSRISFMILASLFKRKLIKNIDIIHTSTYNAAYVSFILSLGTKIPVILTSHEILSKVWYNFKGNFKGFFYKKFEDFIYKFGFYYVFVSNHVKNVAITNYKLNLNKTKVIYNGIDKIQVNSKIEKKDIGFTEKDIVGVFSGRPGRTKGLDFLLDNFNEVQKINPNFKLLLIILEKNNKNKIEKILKKIQQKKGIKVLYEIEHKEIYNYLKLADIGIICSRTEGFGYSGIEFSKLKKTTVMSNIGGIPEINFGDCHFFKVGDKKLFIKCFKEIFEKKVNNYSFDNSNSTKEMFEKYEEIYDFLIEK